MFAHAQTNTGTDPYMSTPTHKRIHTWQRLLLLLECLDMALRNGVLIFAGIAKKLRRGGAGGHWGLVTLAY